MNLLIQIILMAAAVVIAAYLIPGVEVVSFRWAIIVAIVIALLNATVWSILRFLTLPLNWLTLGLVGWIITVLMIMLASNLLDWFEVGGFWNAVIFAIVLALLSALFGTIKPTK
jgi:putative membrane protein